MSAPRAHWTLQAHLKRVPTQTQRGCLRVLSGALRAPNLNTLCPSVPRSAPHSDGLEMRYTGKLVSRVRIPLAPDIPYEIRDIRSYTQQRKYVRIEPPTSCMPMQALWGVDVGTASRNQRRPTTSTEPIHWITCMRDEDRTEARHACAMSVAPAHDEPACGFDGDTGRRHRRVRGPSGLQSRRRFAMSASTPTARQSD
jgi:hypothetical protein